MKKTSARGRRRRQVEAKMSRENKLRARLNDAGAQDSQQASDVRAAATLSIKTCAHASVCKTICLQPYCLQTASNAY